MTLGSSNIKGILGWALLAIGIFIIFWALYSSYNIFLGKKEAPQMFSQEIEKEASSDKGASTGQMQEEMKRVVADQIKDMVLSLFISRILNLISWSIFVGILIFGGSKISLLGIRLIKK